MNQESVDIASHLSAKYMVRRDVQTQLMLWNRFQKSTGFLTAKSSNTQTMFEWTEVETSEACMARIE